MQDGIYVAVSGQVAIDKRLDTLAGNLANSRTVGFRASEVRFEEVLQRFDSDRVSMVSEGREILSNRSGAIEQTGNDLDFAIKGEAWFSIATPAGTVMTRDGRFTIRDDGALVSLGGHEVLDAGGAPIELDPNGRDLSVAADGSIRQNGQVTAGIGLYTFEPGENFQRFGESGIVANASVQPVVDQPQIGVLQGYVEQSNVDPVQEITRLITLQRSFEQSSSAIEKAESSIERLIQALNRA